MVAIARALVTNPSVLLLDEISLGLAPVAVDQVYKALAEIKNGETALVIVEQDISRALDFSDRFYCLLGGSVSLTGKCAGFPRDEISHAYFGDRP
jgi:branched-chain amino acid transport system ATP-binding protein